MPRIPLSGIKNLPSEVPPLPEDISYTGVLSKVKLSDNPAKNDHYFLGVQIRVTEPEQYKGTMVFDNYIPIPNDITPDMTGDERAEEEKIGVRLKQLIASGNLPYDDEGLDTDEWLNSEIHFTSKSEEFNGQKVNRVNRYLLRA